MSLDLRDYGKDPFVINIEEATLQNDTFRTALWTGSELQVTRMSIPVGGDIGGEIHTKEDQFLRLEQGQGRVRSDRFRRSVRGRWRSRSSGRRQRGCCG